MLTFTTSGHQVLESPWAPFDEFSTAADTPAWLVLRGSTNAAAGTRFTAFTMELGYIDF